MSFDEQWAQHKADAAARMQLDQAHPGGGSGVLQTDNQGIRQAAEHLENTLIPDTWTSAIIAVPGNSVVVGSRGVTPGSGTSGELARWSTQSGLQTAADNWQLQAHNLVQRLTGEKDALRGARVTFMSGDLAIGPIFDGVFPNQFGNPDPTGIFPAS